MSPDATDRVAGQGGLDRLLVLLRTFGDPVRLRLLSLLAGTPEVCVCHLHEALGLPQSTVSRHLAQLREAGLIVGRREGTWVYYRLARPADDLHRVLAGCLDPRLVRDETFEEDRRRLEGLSSCGTREVEGDPGCPPGSLLR